MGRFYADLNKLKQDEILIPTILTQQIYAMPLVESLLRSTSAITDRSLTKDRDGDVVMANTPTFIIPSLSSPPISLFKDNFNFDRFSFDSSTKTSSSKTPSYSPVSPATPAALSISTASPTSYFLDSPTSPAPSTSTVDSDTNSPTDPNDPSLPAHQRLIISRTVLPSSPSKPLPWVWQCHMCRFRYPLAVTRRCLIDGHYYCSGESQNSNSQRPSKRRRKQQSCTSEFDYVGWRDWGCWRRKTLVLKRFAEGESESEGSERREEVRLKGCEGCRFPSQCRYENRPAEERLDFGRWIEEGDVIRMKEHMLKEEDVKGKKVGAVKPLKQNVLTKGEPKSAPAGSIHEKAAKTSAATSEKAKKSLRVNKKALRTDSSSTKSSTLPSAPASPNNTKSSKRQRFYSSFANNNSSATYSSSAPEASNHNAALRGEFNPTPPSISSSASAKSPIAVSLTSPTTASATLTSLKDTHGPRNCATTTTTTTTTTYQTELEVIEENLKAVLAGQRIEQSQSQTRPASSSPGLARTQSGPAQSTTPPSDSKPLYKSQINSKIHDPECDISPSDLAYPTALKTSTTTSNPTPGTAPSKDSLKRTNSQQSLLTDFFGLDSGQVKDRNSRSRSSWYIPRNDRKLSTVSIKRDYDKRPSTKVKDLAKDKEKVSYAERAKKAAVEDETATFLQLKTPMSTGAPTSTNMPASDGGLDFQFENETGSPDMLSPMSPESQPVPIVRAQTTTKDDGDGVGHGFEEIWISPESRTDGIDSFLLPSLAHNPWAERQDIDGVMDVDVRVDVDPVKKSTASPSRSEVGPTSGIRTGKTEIERPASGSIFSSWGFGRK